MSLGLIRSTTSAALYPSIRSAPTLNSWITPFSSVAMLEKFALLRIAVCSAPAIKRSVAMSAPAVHRLRRAVQRLPDLPGQLRGRERLADERHALVQDP